MSQTGIVRMSGGSLFTVDLRECIRNQTVMNPFSLNLYKNTHFELTSFLPSGNIPIFENVPVFGCPSDSFMTASYHHTLYLECFIFSYVIREASTSLGFCPIGDEMLSSGGESCCVDRSVWFSRMPSSTSSRNISYSSRCSSSSESRTYPSTISPPCSLSKIADNDVSSAQFDISRVIFRVRPRWGP